MKRKTTTRLPGKTKPASLKHIASKSSISFDLSVKSEGLEPVMGAAYLLTDRAFAWLEGDRAKSIKVTLRPKELPATPAGLKALAEVFGRELKSQKLRWAIAKNNLPVREYIAEQAVLLANGGGAPAAGSGAAAAEPAAEQLTAEQRAEIEKLIAEVETEIKAMNEKKLVSDPKNIKASWEEKQETKAERKA